jgi:outer membrane murein-binding lipoprotein Lpp
MHLATNLRLGKERGSRRSFYPAFLRGISPKAFLVHDVVTLTEGRAPRTGEVVVGRLVPERFGVSADRLAVGSFVRFEGPSSKSSKCSPPRERPSKAKSGPRRTNFAACTRRDDLNAVFVKMETPEALSGLELFAKRRVDLELVAIPSTTYYRELSEYFDPIRRMAWLFAALVALASVAGGANTLNAAVQDRIRELATLRAVGHSGFTLARSLAMEALVIAAVGSIAGLLIARFALSGGVVRIAMGAFELDVDPPSVLIGVGGTLLVALIGFHPRGYPRDAASDRHRPQRDMKALPTMRYHSSMKSLTVTAALVAALFLAGCGDKASAPAASGASSTASANKPKIPDTFKLAAAPEAVHHGGQGACRSEDRRHRDGHRCASGGHSENPFIPGLAEFHDRRPRHEALRRRRHGQLQDPCGLLLRGSR